MGMNIREFCEFVGISPRLYYKLKSKGEGVPEVRLGKRVVVMPETAAAWLKSREVTARVAV